MSHRIRRSVAIAASAIVPDQLTTDAVELDVRIASRDGVVRLMATESATGLRVAPKIAGQQEAPNMEPRILATMPVFPDDVMYEGPILEGQPVALQVLNTTAGILTLNYDLEIP